MTSANEAARARAGEPAADDGPALLPRTTENPWRTLGSIVAYETRFLRVREDHVLTPAGTPGTYGVVEFPHPVAVIAALDAAGRLCLVREWRYAWNSDSWELPGGGGAPGESPLEAARRELREEAGVLARHWTSLGVVHVSAVLATSFHLFLARDLQAAAPQRDDEEQDMVTRWAPLADAVAAALDGTIQHAASITAILRLEHFLRRELPAAGAQSSFGFRVSRFEQVAPDRSPSREGEGLPGSGSEGGR